MAAKIQDGFHTATHYIVATPIVYKLLYNYWECFSECFEILITCIKHKQ